MTATLTKEPAARAYHMPEVQVGEIVVYYPEGLRHAGRPAVVTHVGADTLALSVIEKDAFGFAPVDGVRHHTDPALANPEARANGSWEEGPTRKQFEHAIDLLTK